jgi:ariadne-1
VQHEQNELIQSACATLSVPRPASLALLLSFGWNKERLLETYSAGNAATQALICAEAGTTNLVRVSRGGAPGFIASPRSEMQCLICLDNLGAGDMAGLSCGHRFCDTCWKGYLQGSIAEGSTSIFTNCPMAECKEVCTEDHFKRFCGAAEFLAYRKFLSESYVDINSRIRWCPGKGCGKAIAANPGAGIVRDVLCVCGTEFCFRCQEEAHFPLTCTQREAWTERCDLESGAANWILENTKKCPKCATRIEKNSGCNKISCNAAGCGHEFCWICLGPWSEHGSGNYYGCNKFQKKSKSKKGGANKENRTGPNTSSGGDAGSEKDRFLHFFKRFMEHQKAQEFSEKYLRKARDKIRKLHRSRQAVKHVDRGEFYIDAARMVVRCRRLLKYSYAFAHGLAENESTSAQSREVFEYMQSNLESNTETLSEMSEKPFDQVEREAMLNFVAGTKTLVENLRKGIQGGLTSSAYTRILRFNQ